MSIAEAGEVAAAAAAAAAAGVPSSTHALAVRSHGADAHRHCIFILAATNRVSAIDPALRRPGRFDREVEVGIPGGGARADILRACLSRYPCQLSEGEVNALAGRMHGYVGADIAALCREASAAALRRVVRCAASVATRPATTAAAAADVEVGRPGAAATAAGAAFGSAAIDGSVNTTDSGAKTIAVSSEHHASSTSTSDVPVRCGGAIGSAAALPHSTTTSTSIAASLTAPSTDAPLALTLVDMEIGLRTVQPSALREIAVEVPTVLWSDIGGQDGVKQLLKEAVEWPLTYPEAFERMGIRPPKGVLLYGPPGVCIHQQQQQCESLLDRECATAAEMYYLIAAHTTVQWLLFYCFGVCTSLYSTVSARILICIPLLPSYRRGHRRVQ